MTSCNKPDFNRLNEIDKFVASLLTSSNTSVKLITCKKFVVFLAVYTSICPDINNSGFIFSGS